MLSNYIVHNKLKENVFAIYNTFIGEPVFVSENELKNILQEQVSDETKEVLYKKRIYVKNVYSDEIFWKRIVERYKKEIGKVEFVMVMMTNGCNLACEYCIEKAFTSKMKYQSLGEEVIDAFFNLVNKRIINLKPNVEFVLYGGEPLLNIDGLKYFLKKRKMLEHSRCSIVTNGLLLNEELIDILEKEKVTIGISVDGPREITDKNRKFKDSSKSVYDKIKEKIILLKNKDVSWGISVTITDEMIENKRNFFDWLDEIQPKAISFNLLKLAFDGKTTKEILDYYQKASKFLIEAHQKLLSLGILEKDMRRKIDFFSCNQPVFADCAASSINQITLNTNGNLYSCQCNMDEEKLFGNVLNMKKTVIPKECFNMFERLPIFKEYCRKCFALPVCGGGCLVQGRTVFHNDEYIDIGYCEHAKFLMRWFLERLYRNGK